LYLYIVLYSLLHTHPLACSSSCTFILRHAHLLAYSSGDADMTSLLHRAPITFTAWLGLALATLTASGCKKADAPAPGAASAAGTKAPDPSKTEPLKVAFAYVGPVGDGGWTFAR